MSDTHHEEEAAARRTTKAARHYEAFLGTFGVLERDELAAAGRRMAELMEDWTRAARQATPTMSLFPAPPNADWVAMDGIAFHGLCEHHLLPFFGTIDVAILPGEVVAGFSSIVRVIEHLCRKPQLQEGLVEAIADALDEALAPRGLWVRLSARQLCMEMRGRGTGVRCISVAARGICREDTGRRQAIDALEQPQQTPTAPVSTDGPPVLLVGAGVAGISCALWLRDFGIPFEWIDLRGQIGGHLRRVYNPIRNYVGLMAEDGERFVRKLESQLVALELQPKQCSIDRLVLPTRKVVVDGALQEAGVVVLATGVRPRPLHTPGAERLGERMDTSSNRLARRSNNKRVVTVGGGDGALEGSLNLVQRGGAAHVTILQRSELRARAEFVEAVQRHPAITVRTGVQLRRIETEADVLRCVLEHEGRQEELEADHVLVKIGYEPVLPPVEGEWQTHGGGYPRTDDAWRLHSADWVYAIGDVSSSAHQTVAHAVAQGATVAMDIARRMKLFA
ncbi:MAG: GTP cyclohydrolase I [Myxococcota bacterium]